MVVSEKALSSPQGADCLLTEGPVTSGCDHLLLAQPFP